MIKASINLFKKIWSFFEDLLDKYAWLKEQLEIERIFELISRKMMGRILRYRKKEFNRAIADLIKHPVVQNERQKCHHKFHSRLDHMYLVAKISFFLAHKLGVDPWNCARAGILHDVNAPWYHTDRAVGFARRLGENEVVLSAIKTHMFMTRIPKHPEGWILVAADGLATIYDVHLSVRVVAKHILFKIAYRFLFVYNFRSTFV